jgi:radical SAM protein with 4Fe4S-binding SPASM domain
LEEIGLASFSTNEAYACGATERSEDGIMLTPAKRERAMQTLAVLEERYPGRISANAGPQVLARELKMIDERLAAGERALPGRGRLSACGGVFNTLAVLHDGTMVPCHNLSTLHLGKIGIDDLQGIWLHHATMNALRQRREIPLSTLASCRGCRYQGFCTGGCPGGALQANGDFNSRNPADCYRILKGEDPWVALPRETAAEEARVRHDR